MIFLYLIERFFKRIIIFLEHWYIGGARKIFRGLIELLRNLDRTFALKITLKNIFTPLYKDYSFLGYVLGLPLRGIRILVSIFIYFLISCFTFIVFVLWCFFPIYLLFCFLGIIYV